MIKLKNLLLLSLCFYISACKDEAMERCKNFYSQKTYQYEDTCKCLQKQAKSNKVEDFGELITYIETTASEDDFMGSILASKMLGKSGGKTEIFLSTLTDAASLCHLKDEPLPKDAILFNTDGSIKTELNGARLCVTTNDYNEEGTIWEKYFYRGTNFNELFDMVYSNTKNVNIKADYDRLRQKFVSLEDFFEKVIKANKLEEAQDAIKLFIFVSFDDNFARAFHYYKTILNKDIQTAVDLSYYQAINTAIHLLMDTNKLTTFLRTREEFYGNLEKTYNDIKENKDEKETRNINDICKAQFPQSYRENAKKSLKQ